MEKRERQWDTLPCKKIDVHTHLSGRDGKMTEERRLILNEALGIERSIILPAAGYMGITKQPFTAAVIGNAAARRVCLRHPGEFSWFCNVYPAPAERIGPLLRQYRDEGACGVGEFASQLPFDHPLVESVLAGCRELGLPFLFHMSPEENWGYGVVDGPGLPLLEKELRKFPEVQLIGHSKAFWYEIAKGPKNPTPALRNSCPAGAVREGRLAELFRTFPNLWGDLSAQGGSNALLRDEDYGLSFLREFQDRLLFGTDALDETSLSPLGGWLDRMYLQGKITGTVYRKVCRDNALRLLKIGLEQERPADF